MTSTAFDHYGHEVFSGGLLDQRASWGQIKAQLPAHSSLLVAHRDNPDELRTMLAALKCSIDKNPVSVIVLL